MANFGETVSQSIDTINQMTREQLQKTFELSDEMLDKFLAHRESVGAYTSLDDLRNIPGFEDKTIEKFRSHFDQARDHMETTMQKMQEGAKAHMERSQQLMEVWTRVTTEQFQANAKYMSDLMGAKSPTEFFEKQNDFVRETQSRWTDYAKEVGAFVQDKQA